MSDTNDTTDANLADLVERSGHLKRRLVDYSKQPRFARALQKYLDDHAPASERNPINYWDTFILEHPLPDGRTVLDSFLATQRDLTDEERELMSGWRDPVFGVFRVVQRHGGTLETLNLVDDMTYRIHSNMGATALEPAVPGSYLATRVVPIGDDWLLSGGTQIVRPDDRETALQLAADISRTAPHLVFRNPEKVAQGWELQRKDREGFIGYFGTDVVTGPGAELSDRLRQYWTAKTEKVLREHRAAAERRGSVTGHSGGSEGTGYEVPDAGLSPELMAAPSVAMVYDEVEGLLFCVDYTDLEAVFADPTLMRRQRYRELVTAYLRSDSLPPVLLRRVAERDPQRSSEVFRQLLKKPRFSWERDGEALLRRYKRQFFEREPMPSFTPVSTQLAGLARSGAQQPGGTTGEPDDGPRP